MDVSDLALVGEAYVADRLAAATGLSAAISPVLELKWAARKFLEAIATCGRGDVEFVARDSLPADGKLMDDGVQPACGPRISSIVGRCLP